MSSDPNRPRPRSSKKRRAVQSGARSAAGRRGPAGQRGGREAVAPTGKGGLSTPMLAVIAVVVFGIGVALAAGVFPFGGGTPSAAARASVAPRGINCPTAQPPAAPAGESRVVTIQTAKGNIEITLQADLSPIAVGNFEALAGCGFYDGVVFHRAASLQDGTPFVIQGGDPTGTGRGGPGYEIQDEPVTATYGRGTVAMARSSQPNSVGSQFFIVLDDGARSTLASANTYQIIGTVTSGMETADAIFAAAHGVELPADPVAMTKVTLGPPIVASPEPGSPGPSPSASAPAASLTDTAPSPAPS